MDSSTRTTAAAPPSPEAGVPPQPGASRAAEVVTDLGTRLGTELGADLGKELRESALLLGLMLVVLGAGAALVLTALLLG